MTGSIAPRVYPTPGGIGAVAAGPGGAYALLVGTSATRPDAGPAGVLYFESDTGRFALGTGAGWQNLTAANADVFALTKIPAAAQFSAYPLAPGTDVAHDNAAGVGALGVSQGLTAGGLIKVGAVANLSGAAVGVVTSAVAFGAAFPAALDAVQLTIRTPSSQAIGISAPWTTAEGLGGFTINVNVTAAVAGSTFNVGWEAKGH